VQIGREQNGEVGAVRRHKRWRLPLDFRSVTRAFSPHGTPIAVALGVVCACCPARARAEEAAARTLATEDPFGPPPVTTLDPIEVTTNVLDIAEIVDRCIRREEEMRERYAAYDRTERIRTSLAIGGSPAKEIVIEEVRRIETRRPESETSTLLARHEYEVVDGVRTERDVEGKGRDGEAVEVKFEDFDDLPFYLEDRGDYDFSIEDRQIVGNRVIYRVRLKPKSDFEVAPEGRIWIDTSLFQILREEFDFGDRVPMPIFVKSIGPVVREREAIGEAWVVSRFLARVDLRVGWLRFMDDEIPDRVEIVATYRDHVLEEKK
jgi:hypothetical protein